MVSNSHPPPRVAGGKFVLLQKCLGCKKVLSRTQIFYSNGVCPFCGRDSNSTMCDTTRESVREGGVPLVEPPRADDPPLLSGVRIGHKVYAKPKAPGGKRELPVWIKGLLEEVKALIHRVFYKGG